MLVAMGFALHAQQVATLQSAGVTTVFNSTNPLIDAYNAAATGDTILLSGGGFAAPPNFAKGITVIGAGFSPDSTTATFSTLISGTINLNNGCDSLYMEGLELAVISMYYNQKADFVSFVRCKIAGVVLRGGSYARPVAASNFSFIQCVVEGTLDMNSTVNSLLASNIINGQLYNCQSNTIQNCIFLYQAPAYYIAVLENSHNNTFNNNIFITSNVFIADASSSNFFQYNIFTNTTPTLGTTTIDINNYKSVPLDSIFVNQNGNAFSFTDNYHLKANAASTYIGFDNTQVGVYGGFMPLREGWVPMNPHINFKFIPSVTDNAGFLNIQVKVRAQQ